jgi:hypothetical protein
MVHKPKHKVHSFRGLLSDGGQDEINLERQNVNLAYRIIKFEGVPNAPGTVDGEHITKVYREEQSSIDGIVDFDDVDLLGSLDFTNRTVPLRTSQNVIFDNVLFSRNIYVTHTDITGSASGNYYIEIEEVPVNAATLMQIKLGSARKLISGSMGK